MAQLNIPLEKFGSIRTPFYFYDVALLKETLSEVARLEKAHHFDVHYAVKANVNDRILEIINEAGLGADCVSGNEVSRVIGIGFPSEKVVFAGVGKTDREIETALSHNIFGFNCESIQEVQVINSIALNNNKRANVSIRINPNVDAKTHKHITTGLEENKFGINLTDLDAVLEVIKASKGIDFKGLHFHIGSQVTDMSRFLELCSRINDVSSLLEQKGIEVEHINAGGGLGIDYHDPHKNCIPNFAEYFNVFNKNLKLKPGQKLHFELGRAIVGQCGVLVSRVLYEKAGKKKNFLILDAGMSELMRPALYQAYHLIGNLTSKSMEQNEYDVVGPICETTDSFGQNILLPKSSRGDLFAIYSAGAYGQVLSNRYNLRDVPEVIYSDRI
ncbi:MAG: diaminopimelate decarboxylase [Bacteroidetes bacterium]|nr:diaminopimelate decarboxylase [Bacteroidota bacterium]MDA1121674.1 diaminopimelate decarboxylase [Bacteroidota bacterium]